MDSTLPPGIHATGDWNDTDYICGNGTEHNYNYDLWKNRTNMMHKVTDPPIIIIGTTANLLAIIVLIKMLYDTSAFTLLFVALTITDLLLLYLVLFARWIGEQFNIWATDTGEGACKFVSWMEDSMVSLSAWLLAAMTAHRAMTIVWPTHMQRMRLRLQVIVTIVILISSSFLFNSFSLDGMTTGDSITRGLCNWETSFYTEIYPVITWLEIVFNSILPSAVMVGCNCLMIRAVMQSASSSGMVSNMVHQMTVTLIVVSLTFILLTSPYYVTQMANQFDRDLDNNGPFYFWYNVTNILWITNSSIKFFLYILTGSRFREEGKKLFLRSEASTGANLPEPLHDL